MKKNVIKVKRFQKPLICLVLMLLMILSFIAGKITNANADDVSYEYQSDNIGYDSTSNSLNATNVKDAIDELYGKVGKCPTGQFCSTSNDLVDKLGGSGNFVSAYTYDENSCVTGNESGCVKTNCYASGTCPVGTIIDYFVNNATIVRFHVLHDDGETITLQSQKNIVYNVAWNVKNQTFQGPLTVMTALKTATDSWTNVNLLTITNETISFTGVNLIDNLCTRDYNGNVTCSGNKYDIELISGIYRARMITVQEATDSSIGQCLSWVSDGKTNSKSCRMFMNNFLYKSTEAWICKNPALCVEEGTENNQGYWTMNAYSDSHAWIVYFFGSVSANSPFQTRFGARAVVVVDK